MTKTIRTLREFFKLYKKKTKPVIQKWIDGSSEYGHTTQRNRDVFRKISLIPRFLKDINNADTKSTYFGQSISAPLIICPMGGLTQFHKSADHIISEASEIFQLPYFFPDNTAFELSDMNKNKKKYIQSYFHLDNNFEFCKMRIDQAEKHKCRTIGINVDSPIRSISYNKTDTGYDARKHYLRLPKYYHRKKSTPLNWKTLEKIRRYTNKPLILKGILSVEDALIAQKVGINAIWVSNHGGRALETDITGLERIEPIREKLNSKVKLIVDGGIRTGTDIIKCLSIGADYVAIGRPLIYGIIVDKKSGAKRTLELFLEELKTSLRLSGFKDIKSLSTKNILKNF
tara:strand:- start:28897 stop:29925 length:1029 start_codon:yes stop_codon:yes gene_type:complete